MSKSWNHWLLTFLLIMLITVASNGLALTTPAAPKLIDINPSGAAGDWYVGAIPANYDPQKPVLVFVQGKGSNAGSWWKETSYSGTNDMYACAYSSGYRTAFVNFGDADGSEGDMWTNGALLSDQLQRICTYFGVAKVNLICHSKGGIDAQTAIVHSAAYPRVGTVFTLSTPHWGSEVADLAYSSWAGWLADLLGQKTDATYVLQTGYMSYFRSITDNRSENATIKYYTGAGTNWGPFLSALYTGGLYLSTYGDNDGLVTVESAHNPRATHVFTRDLNHDSIRVGNKVWSLVEPKVRTLPGATRTAATSAANLAAPGNEVAAPQNPGGNTLLNGGELQADQPFEFQVPVESAATQITFDLILADPEVAIQVQSPNGLTLTPALRSRDTNFFAGGTHYLTTVDHPEPGYWTIKLQSTRKNAYLLITHYQSKLQAVLSTNQKSAQSGSQLQLHLDWNAELAQRIRKVDVAANLSRPLKHRRAQKVADLPFTPSSRGFSKTLKLPSKAGLYNINLLVEGVLEDGTPFARSQVRSIVVDSTDTTGVQLLRRLDQE